MNSVRIVDLRSDTVTKPDAGMKDAMFSAPLGDDVLGEDPTTSGLEEYVAGLAGKETALFLPSGTMSNQVALGVHLRPGDEVLTHPDFHVAKWECGGINRLWGAAVKNIFRGSDHSEGRLHARDFKDQLNPDDPHYTRSSLVSLENTLNRSGGSVFPQKDIESICSWARQNSLATHLDGARIFHAVAAGGRSLRELVSPFDTVSICLSKGLGSPAGSVLLMSKASKKSAVRLRKLLGGGMRQSGILAAAGLYALKNNVQDLIKDHRKASAIATAVTHHPHLSLEHGEPPETNIVWMKTSQSAPWSMQEFAAKLLKRGIKTSVSGHYLARIVTHRDISEEDTGYVCDTISGIR